MNFNISKAPEQELYSGLTSEMINLYGVNIKFLKVEYVNLDELVFGDHSHLKTTEENSFEIYMLPENAEEFDSGDYVFSMSGLMNSDTVVFYAYYKDLQNNSMNIVNIIGNILIMPSNKIMEITHCDFKVPGINNLYLYPDEKILVKIVCKPYSSKIIQELNSESISAEPDVEYESLEKYFTELEDEPEKIREDLELIPAETVVSDSLLILKPIVDNSVKSAWE